jgi:hypothetical protein
MEIEMDTNEIIIDKDYYCWNGSRMIYFQCETDNIMTIHHNGYDTHERNRCGGDSSFVITFYTIYTNMITKHFCERHANEFIKIAQEKGYKITDMREVK